MALEYAASKIVHGELRPVAEYENIEVVGEASNPLEALSQVEKVSPDFVLMDRKLLHVGGPDLVEAE